MNASITFKFEINSFARTAAAWSAFLARYLLHIEVKLYSAHPAQQKRRILYVGKKSAGDPAKLQAQMEKDGLDAMIITQPEAVFYCTGFASQFLYISNRIGMALAVVPKHGTITLLVSGFEKLAAEQAVDRAHVTVADYPVWIYIRDLDDGREKEAQPDMNRRSAWR